MVAESLLCADLEVTGGGLGTTNGVPWRATGAWGVGAVGGVATGVALAAAAAAADACLNDIRLWIPPPTIARLRPL